MYYESYGRKYKNVKQTYDGYHYDSKLEAMYAKELDLRIKAKDIKSWDRQVKLDLRANDIHICNYFVDFKVFHNDGSEELVEVKGYPTALWKLKVKIMEATYLHANPHITYTVVK